jgi:hypothetical protein
MLICLRPLNTLRIALQSPGRGDSSPAPATGVCPIQGEGARIQGEGATTAHRGADHPRGAEPDYTWRADVDRLLALLVQRVEGVESAVGDVAAGIAKIMAELHAAGIHASKEHRAQSRSTTVRLEAEWVNAGTSNSNDLQHTVSHSHVGDMPEAATPPKHADIQQNPEPGAGPSAVPQRPIVVDLDALSNDKTTMPALMSGSEHPGRTPSQYIDSRD